MPIVYRQIEVPIVHFPISFQVSAKERSIKIDNGGLQTLAGLIYYKP